MCVDMTNKINRNVEIMDTFILKKNEPELTAHEYK